LRGTLEFPGNLQRNVERRGIRGRACRGSLVFRRRDEPCVGERRIQRVNKVVEPIGETKADGQIIYEMSGLRVGLFT